MRCCQHQSIMTSRDMQSQIRDTSITNNQYIGAQSREWTYKNQPFVQPHFLGLGKLDLGFICPEWRGILSIRYMSKQLTCRILYIWLQWSVVKWRVLLFATIIKPLCTRWVYERALSLALSNTNVFVDKGLLLTSYLYEVSPIAIVSQYEHIFLMM